MRRKRDGDLRNAEIVHPCLDNHLEGKLHPDTLQLQCSHCFRAETAEAAIEIATFFARKKQTPNCCQKRITKISVHRWHRARDDAAAKAVPHNQIVACAKLFDERRQSRKVVAFVRVSHDDIFAFRCVNTCRERRPVPTSANGYNSSVHALGDVNGAVCAAIIDNNNFARDAMLFQEKLRLFNASRQGATLVEAGHHNG